MKEAYNIKSKQKFFKIKWEKERKREKISN